MESQTMWLFDPKSSLFVCGIVACMGLISLAVVFAAIFASGKISEQEDKIELDRYSDPDYNPFNPLDHEQSK